MGWRKQTWYGSVIYVQKYSVMEQVKRYFEDRKTIKLKKG